MGVQSRRSNEKRRRAATVSVGDGGGGDGVVDLISGLNDDLLVHILDLVPDAENVVRTHALSRRWRGLWTGVTVLRFDYSSHLMSCRSDAAAERYIAFVNGALALRATAAKEPTFVEDLTISFDLSKQETEKMVPLSVEATQGWIRYALQHAVKSLILKLRLPWRPPLDRMAEGGDVYDIELPVVTLDEIDSYAKMENMHLNLGGAELRLPSSTVVFSSLTDVSLEDINITADGGYLFSRLVSSACCPCLHKLRLQLLSFELSMMEVLLRIEADVLLELSLEYMQDLKFLELRTPSLQVFCIKDCFELNGFTVSAPRLEHLTFLVPRSLRIDDVRGQLSSVETLKIQLFSHGETGFDDDDKNDASIRVLQCCRLTRCLEVQFEVPKTKYQTVDIIKGRIPLLPHVTQLAVHIILRERHSAGPGVACLLAQCSNIKYLSLQLCYIITKKDSELDLLCDNSCHWKSHEFSMAHAHLQEVEFKKLMGTDCEFQFIQSILTKATGIRKVTISFDQLYWRKGRKHAFKLMPPLDGGLWTTCKESIIGDIVCEWRPRE